MHVDGTDIGSSDHFLVWMDLGWATKTSKKRKREIRRCHLDRFRDHEVKLSYQNTLRLRYTDMIVWVRCLFLRLADYWSFFLYFPLQI